MDGLDGFSGYLTRGEKYHDELDKLIVYIGLSDKPVQPVHELK